MPDEKTSMTASSDGGQTAQSGSDIDRYSEAVSVFIESEVPRCVSAGIPRLADMLAETIPDIAMETVIKKHAEKWRLQECRTLDDMLASIAHELPSSLVQSDMYNRTMRQWGDPIDADLSRRWSEICQRLGVDSGWPGEIKLHGVKDCPCLSSPDNWLLVGMWEYVGTTLPTAITEKLFTYFMAMPGVGPMLLLMILNPLYPNSVSRLIRENNLRISREVVARVTSFDFPKIPRGLLTDAIIDELVRHPAGNVKGMGDSIREIVLGEPFAAKLIDAAKKQAYELLTERELAPDAP